MGRIVLPVYTPHYIPTGDEVAVIETSRGTIRVQLAGKDAPVTVGNFVELAARGFYDKLNFTRTSPAPWCWAVARRRARWGRRRWTPPRAA